jgi:uncharacterized membrane protein
MILIHFPLGLLGLGILIELLSFICKPIGLRAAGRWMILLGSLLAVPAALAGIFALHDDLSKGVDASSWNDLLATIPDKDWKLAKHHFLLTSTGCLLSLFATISWLSACNLWRGRLYPVSLILLLIAQVCFVDGAWHGGEMVYRRGFGVSGQYAADTQPLPPKFPTNRDDIANTIDALSPIQLHIIAAGFVFSLALAGVGITLRKSALVREDMKRLRPAMISPYPPGEAPIEPVEIPIAPSSQRQISNSAEPFVSAVAAEPMPVSSVWLLAALVAIGTVAGGFFYATGTLYWSDISREFHEAFSKFGSAPRLALHLTFGGSILLLSLILALLARWKPHKRSMLGIICGLLILIAVAQVWIGTLLLYDSDSGSAFHFQPASAQTK